MEDPDKMERENLENYRFSVEGVGLVFICSLGVLGNISCILCFSTKICQKNFHQLMLSLAVADLFYIILNIFLFGIPSLFMSINETNFYLSMVPILLPFAQMSLTASIYLTLAIAVERYTTVCHPFFKISHAWTSSMYIVPITFFAIIFNTPKFFELKVSSTTNTTLLPTDTSQPVEEVPVEILVPPDITRSTVTEQVDTVMVTEVEVFIETSKIVPTSLRLHPLYVKLYLIYSNLVIHGVIPLFLLCFLNKAIYSQIRKLRDGNCGLRTSLHVREVRLAQVSLGIVAVFVICHSVKWIPNIYELVQVEKGKLHKEMKWPIWIEYMTCTSHLLTCTNSSVNFYIYVFKHLSRNEDIIQYDRSGSYPLQVTTLTSWKSYSRTNISNGESRIEEEDSRAVEKFRGGPEAHKKNSANV